MLTCLLTFWKEHFTCQKWLELFPLPRQVSRFSLCRLHIWTCDRQSLFQSQIWKEFTFKWPFFRCTCVILTWGHHLSISLYLHSPVQPDSAGSYWWRYHYCYPHLWGKISPPETWELLAAWRAPRIIIMSGRNCHSPKRIQRREKQQINKVLYLLQSCLCLCWLGR